MNSSSVFSLAFRNLFSFVWSYQGTRKMTAGSRKLYNGTTTVHLTLTVYKYKTYTEVEINKNYSLTLPHRKSLCHGWPQPASFFQGRQRRESLGTRLWKLLVFWKLVVEERWPQLEVWLYLQDGRWFITTLSWSFKKATLSNSSTGDILCTIKITTQGTYLTIKFPWIACGPPPPFPPWA